MVFDPHATPFPPCPAWDSETTPQAECREHRCHLSPPHLPPAPTQLPVVEVRLQQRVAERWHSSCPASTQDGSPAVGVACWVEAPGRQRQAKETSPPTPCPVPKAAMSLGMVPAVTCSSMDAAREGRSQGALGRSRSFQSGSAHARAYLLRSPAAASRSGSREETPASAKTQSAAERQMKRSWQESG